ncbi:hypothetical protein, partial [Cognatilysobacter lacus]
MPQPLRCLSLAATISLLCAGNVRAQDAAADRVTELEKLVHAQAAELSTLKQSLDAQSHDIAELREQLHERRLDDIRGEGEQPASLAGAAATA